MTADLVDYHCHLDLFPDHATAFAGCERDRVHVLAVTTTPKAWPHNRDLAAKSRFVRAALGLHPQLVAERAGELALWEEYLPQARYVGEIGLDAGPRHYRSIGLQKEVFERMLRLCASAGGKILTVHSARAASAVLDLVEAHLPPSRGRVVLHWFSGSRAEAQRAIDLGCYFSINVEMLRNTHHRELVAALPYDRLLTETDGPFTQTDGRPTLPRDVASVVKLLAKAKNAQTEEIATVILSNMQRLEIAVQGA